MQISTIPQYILNCMYIRIIRFQLQLISLGENILLVVLVYKQHPQLIIHYQGKKGAAYTHIYLLDTKTKENRILVYKHKTQHIDTPSLHCKYMQTKYPGRVAFKQMHEHSTQMDQHTTSKNISLAQAHISVVHQYSIWQVGQTIMVHGCRTLVARYSYHYGTVLVAKTYHYGTRTHNLGTRTKDIPIWYKDTSSWHKDLPLWYKDTSSWYKDIPILYLDTVPWWQGIQLLYLIYHIGSKTYHCGNTCAQHLDGGICNYGK